MTLFFFGLLSGVTPHLKGLNELLQSDTIKTLYLKFCTLLVTNIRLFIRQTKKKTLFDAQIFQNNHCVLPYFIYTSINILV